MSIIGLILACSMATTGADASNCSPKDAVWRLWANEAFPTKEECVSQSREYMRGYIVNHMTEVLAEIKGYDPKGRYGFSFKCYEEAEGIALKAQYPDLPADDDDEEVDEHGAVDSTKPGLDPQDFLNNK